jgi:phage shock protein PspC (stress-responsive transcriptional regulator)
LNINLEVLMKKYFGRKWRRISDGEIGWLGGVCSGTAYAIGIPTWIVRLAWVISIVGFGVTAFPYLILWIFMPDWDKVPKDYEEIAGG